MAGREDLKKLIDELPDAEVGQLVDFAQFLRQKVARRSTADGLALLDAASPDDEPDNEEEREEARRAWDEHRRDGGVRLEDFRAELGL